MKTEERISGALQENILTLLCFDRQNCRAARAALTVQLFESAVYREVAGVAIDFIDKFGEPVGDHLADELEGALSGEDKRKAAVYRRLLEDLYSAREGINGEYVLSQLHRFVRAQNLKDMTLKAIAALEDGDLDLAEVELRKGMEREVRSFEPGLSLSTSEGVDALFAGELEEEGFRLGIPELDRAGIMPRRKEQMLFVAPRKRGKSWFCTHVAKMALLQRWSCVVITLEMSEKRYGVRFLQSFFSISRRDAEVRVTRLHKDADGNLEDVVNERIRVMTLADEANRGRIAARAKREFRRRSRFAIKQFPMQSLTIEELEAWLDGLERARKFSPDCLIVDYPDLMRHDVKNKRLEIGQIQERLRGIAVKRNLANVIVTQGNRESESSTTVTSDQASEDISKIATADAVLTYSQTPAEKKLGLARLLVAAARNESDGFSVLVSQNYEIGQFCLDSAPMREGYSPLHGAQRDWGEDDDADDRAGPPSRRGAPRDRRDPGDDRKGRR